MGTTIHKLLEMNEGANLTTKPPLELKRLRENATACMQEAVKWVVENRKDLQRAKFTAAVAGAYFLIARNRTRPGDWDDVCKAHGVARTTVNRYCDFAEYCIEQGRLDMPELDDDFRQLDRGIQLVMDSPKAWTALLRYAGMVEKQGQYDPDRYVAQKQAEFDFLRCLQSVARTSDIVFRMPEEGFVPVDKLAIMRDHLRNALERVEARLKSVSGTIEA